MVAASGFFDLAFELSSNFSFTKKKQNQKKLAKEGLTEKRT
jgi:hypothetical protein